MSHPSDIDTIFDSGDFRRIVGQLASGVTVITTLSDGQDAGMTASSVTSLSADPPMMLACLNNAVPTARAVGQTGAYVVNVLGEGQGDLALKFAKPSSDKFSGLRVEHSTLGLPVLSDAIAHLECRVTENVVGGTHTVYMGEVVAGRTSGGGRPLTYFQGGFGRFEFAHNDEVYSSLRQMVIDRTLHPDETLEVAITAQRNNMEEAAVFYAFTRLATEGLLERDTNRGYVVRPFDQRISAEAFDARMMLEREALAIAHAVTNKPPTFPGLRRAMDQMISAIDGDLFRDFSSYVEGNLQFHRDIVGLSGQATMTTLYDSLNLRAVLLRSFGAVPETSSRFLVAQQQVLEALESTDIRRAIDHLQTYTDMAKLRVSEVLMRTGGVF